MVNIAIPTTIRFAGAACALASLAACGTTQTAEGLDNNQYREAVGVYSSPAPDDGLDPIAAAAFWGTRYNKDQSDPAVAVQFSRALRKIQSTNEAVDVMQKANTFSPDDVDVRLEYGKVLVESDRAFEAVRHLEFAANQRPNDWNALSAYGVALDQIGEHAQARKKYDRALSLAPNTASVINNKGLSYALDGNLSAARATLSAAAGSTGGDARMRQNLALVLALSGDMTGAERLARSDLPPRVANNNIDFFRQLMNQPAYWEEYAPTSVDTPDFDAAPLKPAPAPQLKETPMPEIKENDSNGAPIALMGATPVTNTSAEPTIPQGEKESE